MNSRNGNRLLRLAAGAMLVCAALTLPAGAAAVQPTSDFFVNDYAGVLSEDTKNYIMEQSPALMQQTNAQIVVLTVDSLDGKSREEYALEVARDWGIGGAEEDNGVLILLSVGDRQVRVEVGRGLEGALNDAKVGRLLDNYAIPYYSENDFDTGTLELYKAVLSQVMTEYGLEALPGYEPEQETSYPGSAVPWGIIALVIIALIFGGLGRGGRGGRRRRGGPWIFWFPGGGGGGFSGGGFGGSGGFGGGGGGFGGGGGGRSF